MTFNPLTALSPLDGRYAGKVDALREHFSEFGLIRARLKVEIEWLKALAAEPGVGQAVVVLAGLVLFARPLLVLSGLLGLLLGLIGAASPCQLTTNVAALACLRAVENGAQAAVMAPTEILAEQHARSFGRMFANLTHPVTGLPVRAKATATGRPT